VDERRIVVGAVLVDGWGRVLAAERTDGGWEFPGGKVEPGESDPQALVRECREELGVPVRLDGTLEGSQPIADSGYLLRLWTGRIVHGEPAPLVHARLRWVSATELNGLDWLPADRPFLPQVRTHLRSVLP
jgi:NTP pyrophosphohydrolases including oxidative damage repair enzymes